MHALYRGQRPSVARPPAGRLPGVESLESRTLLSAGTGTIYGTVYNDANGNGVKDAGEAGLPGWRVYADLNNNGRFDAGEPSFLSNANGIYELDLAPGTYHVREVVNSGYTQTSPTGGSWTIALAAGQIITGKHFGNKPATTVPPSPPPPPPPGNPAHVYGTVYNDANGNGVKDSGEAGLSGWRVYADLNNNGSYDAGEPNFISNSSGVYELDLAPGTYHIREVVNNGYTQTSPTGGAWTLALSSGQIITGKHFGNKPTTIVPPPPPPPPGNPAHVYGTVYNDANGNGVKDAIEAALPGWRVYADLNNNGRFDAGEPSFLSNSKGIYELDLAPGTYHVREVVNSGYTQTSPTGGAWTLAISSGQIITGKDLGNKPTTVVPPPPPPPPPGNGPFVITSTRVADTAMPGDDIVTFYARNTGTGVLAGTRDILAEDSTLSDASGLVIRASGAGAADFAGQTITPTASFVSLGPSMLVVSHTPGTYHDLQTVAQFEVAGLLVGGILADSGLGARIAVAVVPHGSAVHINGVLGAESGPSVNFSASA